MMCMGYVEMCGKLDIGRDGIRGRRSADDLAASSCDDKDLADIER